MQNSNISKTLFIIILLVLLLNAALSIANVIEDGALWRRVIPAVCWTIAAIVWLIPYLRIPKRKN